MTSFALSPRDAADLGGENGEAVRFALGLLVRFARSVGADRFVDAEAAHIDGCLHHGQVSLDFVERLVATGGRVRIPTTLNVGSIDLIHPELFRGEDEAREAGMRLMRAHEELGCLPTYTCAPYQSLFRPRFGAQLAWAESNAIVFANSVIGARTNRYGDFVDLCCAITGRVPHYGLHVTSNRRARALIDLREVPGEWTEAGTLCVAVGHLVGQRCGDLIPVIAGLPAETNEDDLKALGAVAASSGAVAMFHAVGITPEAPTLEEALQHREPELTIRPAADELRDVVRRLSTVPDGERLVAVSLGTPHFSMREFAGLMPLLGGPPSAVPFYVNTSRDTLAALQGNGCAGELERAGITLVVDTCTYVSAIIRDLSGAVMTNSGKWAYYAPGNLGIEVAFGSLSDCVESARQGRVVRR